MLLKLIGSGPLHLQLYRALRAEILHGRLRPGARLPSTRTIATNHAVSRNTALLAYDQLLGEGYATGRQGSGTYVAEELPDDMTAVMRDGDRPEPSAARTPPRLSRVGRRIRDWRVTWEATRAPLPYDFRYGRPSPTDFPHPLWRKLLAQRLRRTSARELDYGPPAGVTELREALAEYLRRARGVVCTPDQIVIVNGSQQALDLVTRTLVDPGDRVLIEEPSYAGARGVFLAAGARLVTGPVDDEGLDVGALGGRARGVRLAYVTPSHQFPTGAVMSLSRRLALLTWAERERAHVVEDDYDSEYRYRGRPVESLQGLDHTGRVIYVGTFSKLLFPALRLGYLVVPEPLVGPVVAAKALADTGSPPLEQRVLADFLREGHFERHVRRARARNAARRSALLDAVAEHLGNRVEVSGGDAGVHMLLWLRDVRPEAVEALIERAARDGVGVYSASWTYAGRPKRAGLLLGFTSLEEEPIRTGIKRLATVLR